MEISYRFHMFQIFLNIFGRKIFYEEARKVEFNFKQEFESYCWSDVVLLTKGCLAFRLNQRVL
jgi:hypothetical protein